MLFAAVVAVALVVVGCGSSDSAPPITKAEFIKKADAACKKGEEQIQADFAVYVKEHENGKTPTKDRYAELVETILVPNATQEVEDIDALGAPNGDEEQVDAMLTAFEEAVQIAEDEPQAVIKDSEKVFSKSSKLAKAYGLKVCGSR